MTGADLDENGVFFERDYKGKYSKPYNQSIVMFYNVSR